jgi:hypothetical protein
MNSELRWTVIRNIISFLQFDGIKNSLEPTLDETRVS